MPVVRPLPAAVLVAVTALACAGCTAAGASSAGAGPTGSDVPLPSPPLASTAVSATTGSCAAELIDEAARTALLPAYLAHGGSRGTPPADLGSVFLGICGGTEYARARFSDPLLGTQYASFRRDVGQSAWAWVGGDPNLARSCDTQPSDLAAAWWGDRTCP
jgi:hypothetical protein